MTCIFCDKILPEQILTETAHFEVVFSLEQVQVGHLLIIAKPHWLDIRELSSEELTELITLERDLVAAIDDSFEVDGVTMAENNGSIMQAGTHLHVHVIPRYKDDQFWDNQVVVRHQDDLEILKKKLPIFH